MIEQSPPIIADFCLACGKVALLPFDGQEGAWGCDRSLGGCGKTFRTDAKQPQAAALLEAAKESAELFHTREGRAFARIDVNGHREVCPIKSPRFKGWLRSEHRKRSGKPPNSQPLAEAIEQIEAAATFDGPEEEVHNRLAGRDGAVYVDLGNDAGEAVKIEPGGWSVVPDPPVNFVRSPSSLPLPRPERGGSLDAVLPFINLKEPDDKALFFAYLVGALNPRGPYPILVLRGPQGSAKSTVSRVVKMLLDPTGAALRAIPHNERDLMIGAAGNWVLAFDNVSRLAPWLSDALCRISTGGGFATRELYADLSEVVIDACRPLVLNGIEDVAHRHDLLDRTIALSLAIIPESARCDEKTLWADFERSRPAILGALFEAASQALARLESVEHKNLPRMADFARWAIAAESALGLIAGSFRAAYSRNRQEAVSGALEDDDVAGAVCRMMEFSPEWSGTAQELLDRLTSLEPEKVTTRKEWPSSPRGLAARLIRAQAFLAERGIEMTRRRMGAERTITLRTLPRGPDATVTTVTTVTPAMEKGCDDCVTVGAATARPSPDRHTGSQRENDDVTVVTIPPGPSGDESQRDDRDGRDDTFRTLPEEVAAFLAAGQLVPSMTLAERFPDPKLPAVLGRFEREGRMAWRAADQAWEWFA